MATTSFIFDNKPFTVHGLTENKARLVTKVVRTSRSFFAVDAQGQFYASSIRRGSYSYGARLDSSVLHLLSGLAALGVLDAKKIEALAKAKKEKQDRQTQACRASNLTYSARACGIKLTAAQRKAVAKIKRAGK